MTMLKIRYHGVERLIEPYSLKYKTRKDGVSREYFYAYDCTGGHSSGPGIKTFVHQDIQNLENTEIKFEPRFEVEVSKAGELVNERYFPKTHGLFGLRPRRYSVQNSPHVVQCPICGKQFRRKHYDKKLRPHKDEYGNKCVGKVGFMVR